MHCAVRPSAVPHHLFPASLKPLCTHNTLGIGGNNAGDGIHDARDAARKNVQHS
jgi:hypothetical protein